MFEIGNSLREARVRRGIEFAQAEQATKIRAKYLRSLEEERFELLPSETYVKGFLRTYADYLGLDGQLYVDEFNSRFGTDDRRARRAASLRCGRNDGRRRFETSRRARRALSIAVVTVIVISAWKSSGSDHDVSADEAAPRVRSVTKPPAAYLVAQGRCAARRTSRSTAAARPARSSSKARSRGRDGAVQGQALLAERSAPENLVITVGGKRVRIAGHRPRVLTVTPPAGRPPDRPSGRPRGAILVTGSELVRGDRRTANGPYLAQSLLSLGIDPVEVRIVGDAPEELETRTARGARARPARRLRRPRPDARRPHGRAARPAAGRPLVLHEELAAKIETWTRQVALRLRRPYKEFAPGVYKQASVPEGAVVARPRGHCTGSRRSSSSAAWR